jgi:hypothetical protein
MQDVDRASEQTPPGMGQTAYLLRKLRKAGEPITLSVNGRGDLSIKDDWSFQKLIELVDLLETTELLRERLEGPDEDREWLTLEEVKEQARAKYGISL